MYVAAHRTLSLSLSRHVAEDVRTHGFSSLAHA